MKVVWSPLAEQRALEAVDHITQDRPRTAAVWLERLLERVSQLDRFEEQGRVVSEIAIPAYREILYAPHRIIYRVDASQVVILALRHVRRAWDPAEVDDA
jgi:toxin ParE1/3/4